MSSMQQEQTWNPKISEVFENKKLTGYDIACNNELSQVVKRDSTDFATGLIKHERGREIVCELIDVALRPRLLISYLQKKKRQQQQLAKQGFEKEQQFLAQGSVLKSQLNQASKQVTTIVYNAIQILTNQYEEFVQFIFDQSAAKGQLIKSGSQFGKQSLEQMVKKAEQQKENDKNVLQNDQQGIKETNQTDKKVDENHDDDDDDFADFGGRQQKMMVSGPLEIKSKQQQQSSQLKSQQQLSQQQQQSWQDCVIIDSGYPQLTRNEQDQLLKKIISTTKISHSDHYKSLILDRMFLLFHQSIPIQQTPVSYFNKIMLQFVYQKPQQIMRYFYCDESINTKGKGRQSGKDGKKSKKNSNNSLGLSSQSINNSNGFNIRVNSKIRLLARHLYNNSVIELLVHLMELESQGNFFSPQKTQILKSITEQVFSSSSLSQPHSNKTDLTNNLKLPIPHEQSSIMQTSTMSDLVQDRISNFIQFMKQLYEKLQDRYQQQKYLSVFRYYINDQSIIKRIINYFKQQHNYFDTNGLVVILTLLLKFDYVNFVKHKSQQQKSNPFGGVDHFGFGGHNSTSQKEDSSIASYDLKLSPQVLEQIQSVLLVLIKKYRQQQASTMRMVQYYQLLYNWLNITIALPKHQEFNRTQLLTVSFINDCMFKFQEHQRSSILHNAIKNILVDFLPKLNNAIKVILAPQCELVAFIENYLHVNDQQNDKNIAGEKLKNKKTKSSKRKPKCYQNQLFHIGKAVLSIWQQQKMLSVIRRTQDLEDNFYSCKRQQQFIEQQDELEKPPLYSEIPQSPTSDSENLIRFERLREIITKKQEFYNHLICGDPRKIGEYQQEQSSEIIMASSSSSGLKNFFKPNLFFNNNGLNNDNEDEDHQKDEGKINNGQGLMIGNNKNDSNKVTQKHQSKNRYADFKNDDSQQDNSQQDIKNKQKKESIASKRKFQIEDLKKETNLKTDLRYRSLRIGDDNHTQSLFESAISPLNANRSHTFNFEMDALPLDSDKSQQEVISQEQDFPLRKASGEQDEIKLMQQNIENFDMVGGNFVLGMESNILSQNNSISHQRSNSNSNINTTTNNHLLLSTDNHRRQQLSKSVEMPQQLNIDTIQRVQSYLAIQSPRRQSQDEILSLGMDSKHSGSKMSQQQLESRLEVVTSEIVMREIGDGKQQQEQMGDQLRQQQQLKKQQQSIINMNSKVKSQPQAMTTDDGQMSSNISRLFSSYLSYDVDDLCMDLE